MKLRTLLSILILTSSTITHTSTFDYAMTSSIDNLFKREPKILDAQEAFHKLTHVALSFWNSNTKALLNFIKNEHNSIASTLQALSCISESIDLGQALQKANILPNFEDQYLLAALTLDKITVVMNNLHDTNDLKNFNPEALIILKAELTNLLDALKLIKNKLQLSRLDVATHIALQISQPQLAQGKILYSALGQIQTIDMYDKDKTTKNSLKNYKFIIDARNDGNSGYRTFVASVCMHALDAHHKEPIHHLQRLVQDNFFNLFMKYDQLFPQNIKSSIGHAIKKYLCDQLHAIEQCKNIQQIQRLFNEQILFDFYMIKFLKFLIIDYSNTNQDIHSMILTMHRNFETYQKNIISWGNEITDLEFTILTLATNITTSILHQQAIHHSITLHQATPEYGISHILCTQNHHYQIILPKKYRRE